MKLDLVRPSSQMEKEYLDFAADWEKSGEEITPYSARLLGRRFTQWLADTYRIETEAPKNFVTAHTFFLTDGEKILGAVNIRHSLNDTLFKIGGHIGYGVRPSARRHGYAEKMLCLALPIAKSLGIDKALITCDKNNIGSAKTIIANGGILENEVPDDERITQRYWITIEK